MSSQSQPGSRHDLPVIPPVRPMLARLARTLPGGDYLYEPKWDGFRCLAFRSGDEVDLRSRNDRPLARYFPELVAALRALPAARIVLDGEVLVVNDGRADFEALMARLHPAATRAAELSQRTPASLVAFDVLALGDADLRDLPFERRRAVLTEALDPAPRGVSLTPITADAAAATEWLQHAGTGTGGVDGVVAKARDLRYQAGKRAMIKVKTERTADCIVAGARLFSEPLEVASLILALYDDAGDLRHVGVASSLTRVRRSELLDELAPFVVALDEHPWREGFGADTGRVARLPGAATRWDPDMSLDWLPLRPQLVCEVAYEHVEAGLFRHPARFRRWRPDRDAESCRTDQLRVLAQPDVVLPT